MTPQARTREYLTEQGYLVGTVEKKKKFPDRKKGKCKECGHQPFIEISSDLFEVFDLIAIHPQRQITMLVQTTSANNHATRRNKILASMEAKLVLLGGVKILLQSWGQVQTGKGMRWRPRDEEIALQDFRQAFAYPDTVAGLIEIRQKERALKRGEKIESPAEEPRDILTRKITRFTYLPNE